MNCFLQQLSKFFILALMLQASCIDDPSPVPEDKDYVRATLGDYELMIDKENGKIEKTNGGSGSLQVTAETKYGEGIQIEVISALKPGTYILDSIFDFSDSVVIQVTSFSIPRSGVEMTNGKMVIEAISQNPLVLKGKFSGKLIYEWSPQGQQQYDTVLLTGGVVDIKF